MRPPSGSEPFASASSFLHDIELLQSNRNLVVRIQRIIVSEMHELQHVAGYDLTTHALDHVVDVERDEQRVVGDEQTKLAEVEVSVLYGVMTAQAVYVTIILAVSVL